MPLNKKDKQWRAIKQFDRREMVCCTLALAKRHVAEYPNHGVAWLYYAIALCEVSRYRDAFAALRRAAKLCPPEKICIVQKNFGHFYEQKGDFRRAEAWFRKAIDSRPADASAYIYLGGLLALQGRLSEAEAVHRQATLCTDGCIDEAFFNLGLVVRAQDRYTEAITCFRRALELDPKYRAARKELADVERVIELLAPPGRKL